MCRCGCAGHRRGAGAAARRRDRHPVPLRRLPAGKRLGIELPVWLTDPERQRAACEADERVYREIHRLVCEMSDARGRDEANRRFELGSNDRGVVALCSDSMAEGINLQQAGRLVHLDMPSVVRVAEQRVGRVDRMDSPHASSDVWWPRDAPEFALRANERFIERLPGLDRRVQAAIVGVPECLSAGLPRAVLGE